jgi:hypothetical protein
MDFDELLVSGWKEPFLSHSPVSVSGDEFHEVCKTKVYSSTQTEPLHNLCEFTLYGKRVLHFLLTFFGLSWITAFAGLVALQDSSFIAANNESVCCSLSFGLGFFSLVLFVLIVALFYALLRVSLLRYYAPLLSSLTAVVSSFFIMVRGDYSC